MSVDSQIANQARQWNLQYSENDFRDPNLALNLTSRSSLLATLPHNGIVLEVGVGTGTFSAEILAKNQPALLYLVDCWEKQPASSCYNRDPTNNSDHTSAHNEVCRRFEKDSRIKIIKAYSDQAIFQVPDSSLDIIYIDANHLEVGRDIALWWPKVRMGGWLTGHDYTTNPWITVKADVNRFCEDNNLTLYITEEADFPSWAFKKTQECCRRNPVSVNTQLHLKFHHGLGDVLMFRSLLKTLNWPCELLLNPSLGQEAVFYQDSQITIVSQPVVGIDYKTVHFPMEGSRECKSGFHTKPRMCLEYDFGTVLPGLVIRPAKLAELSTLTNAVTEQTRTFLSQVKYPYALCHFQGTCLPGMTNPSESFCCETVSTLVSMGFSVVLVNYDYAHHNSKNADFYFVDGKQVHSTFRRLPAAFESLWHLLQDCSLFIGVVSGPLHAAVGTRKPCIFVEKQIDFNKYFYDAGLERLLTVDCRKNDGVPLSIIEKGVKC